MGRRSGPDHPGSGLFHLCEICNATPGTNANRTIILEGERPAPRGRDASRSFGEIQLGEAECSPVVWYQSNRFQALLRYLAGPSVSEHRQQRIRVQSDYGMNSLLQNVFSILPACNYHISSTFTRDMYGNFSFRENVTYSSQLRGQRVMHTTDYSNDYERSTST